MTSVLGMDGDTRPGRRRASFTWFDTRHRQLLLRTGRLTGDVVTGALPGADLPEETVAELRELAQRWPPPWEHAIDRSLARRDVVGTPVAEYLPTRLARSCVALLGDAAHVVSPVTGAGFHNGLLDVQALAAALRAEPPGRVPTALSRYQQKRLHPARRLVHQSQQWSRSFVSSTT